MTFGGGHATSEKLERRALALARLQRERAAQATAAESRRVAAELRSFYYPKQAAFFTSPAKLRATRKTRRAGATVGGCREFLARAIEHPGWRGTYATSTRAEARDRAWKTDTQSGLVDLLERYATQVADARVATYVLGGVTIEVREAELALEFSNGSRINLFGSDDERSLRKQRGNAKHVFWIDEAQDFRFLDQFYRAVIVAALADYQGECWLSGTPSRDCAGLFYDVTREDGHAIVGWEVSEFRVIDNPFFGATPEERWERTAGAAIRENGWPADDPDLLREWYARWVLADARWVYAAHAVPLHQLCFAPERLGPDGFPDIAAALADLPGWGTREYFLALGADLGTRDDFAFVLWAWSFADPVLYEVCSWKRAGLDYDEMAAHLIAVREAVPIGLVTADAGGGGKPAVMGWSKRWVDRYGIPIIEAAKANKAIAIKQLNNDIRRGLVKVREGSPLLAEWLVHRWAKIRSATGGEVEDPTTPNHASDAGLYGHRESYHHRHRPVEPAPVPGSPEWVVAVEAEMEQSVMDDEGDDDAW